MLKEKVQRDKQRSIKHTHKTKDRVTRTTLKTGGELRCFRRESSSCSTSGTRRVNRITNPVSLVIILYSTSRPSFQTVEIYILCSQHYILQM